MLDVGDDDADGPFEEIVVAFARVGVNAVGSAVGQLAEAVALYADIEPGEPIALAPLRGEGDERLVAAVALRDVGQRLGIPGARLARHR